MTDTITLPRSVVEQALEALFMYKPMVTGVTFQHGLDAMQALRAALDQPQVEQEPTPNGATHRQPKQGAFYKRVDGKWYVWSRMENGGSHRWYISPGTTESCLDPIYTHPQPQVEQEPVAWLWIIDGKRHSVSFGGPNSNTPKDWIVQPLYTHPQPKRQPLTDAEILMVLDAADIPDLPRDFKDVDIDIARAIEAAHEIGGEA